MILPILATIRFWFEHCGEDILLWFAGGKKSPRIARMGTDDSRRLSSLGKSLLLGRFRWYGEDAGREAAEELPEESPV